MISRILIEKTLVSFTLIAAPLGISACAMMNETSNTVEAVLLNPQDSATRQAIRVFVRELSGSAIIANPDSLANSPVLPIQKREIEPNRQNMHDAFKPSGEYRLVMDGNNHCWMTHIFEDVVSEVQLPPSANCAPYQPR